MWPWISGSLAALNLIAFLAQGLDKWRARRNCRRTPEATLLLLAVPLATPGAWAGMHLFHHKVSKGSFKWKMAAVTLLNLIIAAALVFAAGRWDWV